MCIWKRDEISVTVSVYHARIVYIPNIPTESIGIILTLTNKHCSSYSASLLYEHNFQYLLKWTSECLSV